VSKAVNAKVRPRDIPGIHHNRTNFSGLLDLLDAEPELASTRQSGRRVISGMMESFEC
jgi:hypothetical protein